MLSVSVTTTVEFTIGVEVTVAVTVGVKVVVLCGLTVRTKSRSYAIGCASPLLLMIIMDQLPENSWSSSMGLCETISASMRQN